MLSANCRQYRIAVFARRHEVSNASASSIRIRSPPTDAAVEQEELSRVRRNFLRSRRLYSGVRTVPAMWEKAAPYSAM